MTVARQMSDTWLLYPISLPTIMFRCKTLAL